MHYFIAGIIGFVIVIGFILLAPDPNAEIK